MPYVKLGINCGNSAQIRRANTSTELLAMNLPISDKRKQTEVNVSLVLS